MSNDATGTRYAALAGVFVLLVGGVGAAVLLGVVPGGGGGGGGMSLDAVPNGSDVVVHADGVIVDDPTTERIANHAIDRFSTDESGPSSYEELPANATADAEFGVDDFDHATVYGRIPDAGLAVASEDAYLGAVVSTDVGEETFVSALSNSSSEADAEYTVTEGSYAGHTLYVYDETDAADVGAVESDDPLYVGVADGNRYAMGRRGP